MVVYMMMWIEEYYLSRKSSVSYHYVLIFCVTSQADGTSTPSLPLLPGSNLLDFPTLKLLLLLLLASAQDVHRCVLVINTITPVRSY
mmetsp:Transcript_2809/g.4709  ORF Transcript_2809/g.4709 Transcript_2809/m.4709 type:complete len:87 (-) Transcript_2809:54-314(-)